MSKSTWQRFQRPLVYISYANLWFSGQCRAFIKVSPFTFVADSFNSAPPEWFRIKQLACFVSRDLTLEVKSVRQTI